MEKTTLLIISTSCLLSLLCFIPSPVDLIYSQALLSVNVSTSFLCAAVASFPMFLDCLWDVLCKLKWIQMESSRDHSYLIEHLQALFFLRLDILSLELLTLTKLAYTIMP